MLYFKNAHSILFFRDFHIEKHDLKEIVDLTRTPHTFCCVTIVLFVVACLAALT